MSLLTIKRSLLQPIAKLRVENIACIQHRYKSKSSSSTRWINRQKNDQHTKDSKSQNYRSRAAFKLLEIDQKYRIFNKKSKNIVDLGFAPGAWTQVAIERTKALNVQANIIGVDLIDCSPPEGAHFIQGDILSKKTHTSIKDFFNANNEANEMKPVDLIVSDMMANTSGIKDNDHYASMELCDGALILACALLNTNGSIVMKFYTGKEDGILKEKLCKMFHKVFKMKPLACRDELREMYYIGLRKKNNDIDILELFE